MKAEPFATAKRSILSKARSCAPLARIVTALGAAAVAWGCGADVDESLGAGGGPGESTSAETAPLTSCAPSVSAYDVNGGFATGPATSSHLCWVTQFLETTTNYDPYMIVQQSNGVWTASGWGQMMCVAQCAFGSNGGSSDVRWLSPTFEAYKYAGPRTGIQVAETAMWQGDAMNILSGMHHFAGRMRFPGDYASTVWSSTSATTKLHAEPYGGPIASAIGVFGHSFFVGVPQSGHVLKVSNEYTVSSGGQATMIGKDSGICAFTKMTGVGDSYPARIMRTSTNWKLMGGGIISARCFYYDQSQ
jgi:hypothetical protein